MNIGRLDKKRCAECWADGKRLPVIEEEAFTDDEKQIREHSRLFLQSVGKASEYDMDRRFSLELYFWILPLGETFPLRQAADDNIWRRLSVQVMPDLVALRWHPTDGVYPKDHFWAKPQRNWIKSLWWYAHLSCQENDMHSTDLAMINGSTDSIQAVVERPGPGGFRVDLCRQLMGRLTDGQLSVDRLKRVLKLNTAKVCVVEPCLHEGGVAGYVDSLISSVP